MPTGSSRTISLEQLFEAVRRHKFIAVFTFLLIMLMVISAWLFLPREYGSEGRMVVRMGRANLGMNTTPDGARMISIQDTRETEIRSVQALIKSNLVLGAVVDSIGADRILENVIEIPMPLPSGGGPAGDMTSEEYDAHRTREKAIKRLGREIKVESEKKSANIAIFCTGSTPKLAQEIVNAIMAEVQKAHVEVHAVERSKSHFDRGLSEKEDKLRKAQETLARFSSENNFLSVTSARSTLNGVIDKLENARIDASLNLRESLSLVQEYAKQSEAIEMELDMPREGYERQATSGAQEQLYSRIAEKARLLAKYNENHPQTAQINSEIKRLQEEVASLPELRTQSDKVRNPVWEELKISLVKELARSESLQERLAQVDNKLREKEDELSKLNELQTKAAAIERQVQLAQIEFDSYAKKRNDARMIDQLDKEAISDIAIQQPASLVLKKVSPKGSILLPLGAFLATVTGIMFAIFADRKNLMHYSTPEAIEDALDIPVLVTIPRVHSSRVLNY